MRTYSIVFLATLHLASITAMAAPLDHIKRGEEKQQQTGVVSGLAGQIGTNPAVGPVSGIAGGIMGLTGATEAAIPANSQDGLTANQQAGAIIASLEGTADGLGGGGQGQKKKEEP